MWHAIKSEAEYTDKLLERWLLAGCWIQSKHDTYKSFYIQFLYFSAS